VTPPEYEYLRKFLKDYSGLDLSADKQYLIESRLFPLARKVGLSGISELVQKIMGGSAAFNVQVVEAMTTNETFFFRDKVPFEHFRNLIMPQMLRSRANRKSVRIWCAAGSTGQEPYSLAMSLKEMGAALGGWRIEIVATDLSQEVLEKSKAGLYSQFEVQRGLPIQLLVKYFKQVGELWQINPDIRAMVQHRQFNLLHDFSQLGVFDLIFCRNVLIYFDQETKTNIFNRLAKAVEPDGFLVLGAAETVIGLTTVFKPLVEQRGVYQPNEAPCACENAGLRRDHTEDGRNGRDLNMTEDGKSLERVTFSRGYDVCIMAIDGTWRRDCQLNAISDNDAVLTVEGSIQGLNLKEFFLLLSSTGLAYRRCELIRVNGTEMDVQFLKGRQGKKKAGPRKDAHFAA